LRTETAAGSAPPVRHHDPNVRQRLIDIAVGLFAERGYATTSVREIVKGAGVSKPVLYYHFGSKEGLYLEIMRLLERTVHETVQGLRTSRGSATSRIRSLLLGIWDVFSENTAAVRFVNAVFWGPPQGAPAFDVEVLHRPLTDAFQDLADEGVARQEFRKDAAPTLAFALLGTLSFAMDFHLAHPDRSPGREGLSRVLDLVLSGASKPRPSGAPR
jgi:TetR/AcrR family transcriptional regulator